MAILLSADTKASSGLFVIRSARGVNLVDEPEAMSGLICLSEV